LTQNAVRRGRKTGYPWLKQRKIQKNGGELCSVVNGIKVKYVGKWELRKEMIV